MDSVPDPGQLFSVIVHLSLMLQIEFIRPDLLSSLDVRLTDQFRVLSDQGSRWPLQVSPSWKDPFRRAIAESVALGRPLFSVISFGRKT